MAIFPPALLSSSSYTALLLSLLLFCVGSARSAGSKNQEEPFQAGDATREAPSAPLKHPYDYALPRLRRNLEEPPLPEASERVVNGIPANPSRYRWFARLTYRDRVTEATSFFDEKGDACGGVLISDRFVLTAAHCVWDMTNGGRSPGGLRHDAFGAAVGVVCDALDNCGYDFMSLKATHYWVHPQWDPSKFVLDIALVRLGQTVPVSVAAPAAPDLGEHFPVLRFGYDDNLRSLGYGWINDGAVYPSQLQELSVGYMPPDICERYWGRLYNGVVCVYTNDAEEGVFGRGLCKGDSGSPTIIPRDDGPDIVVGVTSFGWFPCTSKDRPDVLGRVSAAASYITNVVCYPNITDVQPPWCLKHQFGLDSGVQFFDVGFFSDFPAFFNMDGVVEEANEVADHMTECTETATTRYHPNRDGKPAKVKPCAGLAKKPKKKQRKVCNSIVSTASSVCCNFCEIYFPSVRNFYHSGNKNKRKLAPK